MAWHHVEINKTTAQVNLYVGKSLSRADYFCSHRRQTELPPAAPETIAFIAVGITMNNTWLGLTEDVKGIKL